MKDTFIVHPIKKDYAINVIIDQSDTEEFLKVALRKLPSESILTVFDLLGKSELGAELKAGTLK